MTRRPFRASASCAAFSKCLVMFVFISRWNRDMNLRNSWNSNLAVRSWSKAGRSWAVVSGSPSCSLRPNQQQVCFAFGDCTVATPFAEQYVHDVNPIATKMRLIACSATRTFNPYRCAGMSFSLGKGAAKIGHDAPLFSRQKCSVWAVLKSLKMPCPWLLPWFRSQRPSEKWERLSILSDHVRPNGVGSKWFKHELMHASHAEVSAHISASWDIWSLLDRQIKKMGSIFACWNVSSQRGLSGINMSSRNNKLTSQRKSLVIPEPNFQECSWLTRQRGSFSWKLTRVMYEILWLPITFKQTGIGHCVSRCIRSGRCLVLDFRFIELFHYLDACRLCVFEMEGGWNWMIWIDELGSMVDGHSMRDHNKSNWTGGNWTGGRERDIYIDIDR